MFKNLELQAFNSAMEIIKLANLKAKNILVVGCSTSEILGDEIGTNSSPQAAKAVFDGIYRATTEKGVFLAAQCCEHLNRAIIIEADALPNAEIVNVIPQAKAGGSFATTAYNSFENPIAVENIKAHAGIDIGFTMIGMHIKAVAVPVRLENNKIGDAVVLAARSRPKFIGGERAVYNQSLT